MKIYTKVVWQWQGGVLVPLEEEWYDYEGPVALALTMVSASYTQEVFQGFGDGTQTGSTQKANADTNFSQNAEEIFHLRFRVAQTVATANQNNVKAFKLKYQKNGTGGYVDVGAIASGIAASYADSASITDNENIATGDFRLGTGTGTAVAGECNEDATQDDITFPIAGSASYTELLYVVVLPAAANANNDTFEFRVYESNDTALAAYTVTPTVTVVETAPTIVQQVFQGFADGTQTGSTQLANSNTNFSIDDDTVFQMRFRIAQTATAANTDLAHTYKLRFQKNGAGGFIDVGAQASATAARYANSASITDNENIATGDFRLGAGTGTAVAGECDENGATDSITFSTLAASYTELLFVVELPSTQNSNNDTIEFRVYETDDTALTTYTVTPTATVIGVGAVTSRLMLEDGFLLFQEDGVSYILLEQQVEGGAVVAAAANLIHSPLIRSMRLTGLARH